MTEKTGAGLQVVIVAAPTDKVNIGEFFSGNQIPGIVVTDQKINSVARQYRVRSYPSAFLLDKDHRVVLAPAKTPLDGFEFQFAGIR